METHSSSPTKSIDYGAKQSIILRWMYFLTNNNKKKHWDFTKLSYVNVSELVTYLSVSYY